VRPSVRVRHGATWLLLALSLAGAAGYTGLRILSPSDGARIGFYREAWSAAGVVIDPIDAPAAGLRAGDQVNAVGGRAIDDWLQLVLAPGVERPGPGSAIEYTINRDGARAQVEVRWMPPALAGSLLAGWSVILFSLATAAIAAYVLRKRPEERAATALVVAACGAAGSSVPWFLGATISEVVGGIPFVLQSILTGPLYMLLWPAAVHLALVFPSPAGIVHRRPMVLPVVYVAAIGAYAAGSLVTLAAAPTISDWVGTWPAVQAAVVVPALAIAVGILAVRYRRLTDPTRKAKLRLATLGAFASGALGLGLFMIPVLLTGRPLVPEAAIGLIAMPLPAGIAAGILRDNLFDIEVVVSRTLVYGGLTVGIVATYAAATAVMATLLGGDQGYGGSLLAAGLAALATLPLRDLLQRGANRLLYGQRDQPWRVMHTLGARLEWAADPGRAFPVIADTVAETLRLPYVAVEVVDEMGRASIRAERGRPAGVVEAVPLVHGAQPVGRLLLGVRGGERGFGPAELDLLRDLGRQAGAAVHAQRLRDDLARSRERLVTAREEERRRLRRDLHDGLGPALAAVGMRADAAAATLDHDVAASRRQLEILGDEVRAALADVRRLVDGLRPPALDDLGLLGAITQQATRMEGDGSAGTNQTRIEVGGDPMPLPALPAAAEVAAYRIAVEAMTNAVRHAGARSCRVSVSAGSQLRIEVVDDGRGVATPAREGTGLESMRERAAELGGEVTVERRPAGGTRVLATLPLGPAMGAVQ
jgi:two-component system NarL family sensor kinase